MTGTSIIVAGIEVPSRDPAFLAVVGVHVLLVLTCSVVLGQPCPLFAAHECPTPSILI